MQRIIFILVFTIILSSCATVFKNLSGNKSPSSETTDFKNSAGEANLKIGPENSSKQNPAQKQDSALKTSERRAVANFSNLQCTQFYENEFSPGLLVLSTECDPSDRLCIGFTQTVPNTCDSQVHKKLIRYVCNCTITEGNNSCEPKQEPAFIEQEILCDQYCENDACIR